MTLRHEKKFVIHPIEAITFQKRLKHLLKQDDHAGDSGYSIRSLYFDNPYLKAYIQNVDGDIERAKFRIRVYNQNFSSIKLERKSKNNIMTGKESVLLTVDEVKQILNKDIEFLRERQGLYYEFYESMVKELVKPKVIIEYRRIPFIYDSSQVRVTFDHNLITSHKVDDFLLDKEINGTKHNDMVVMEVKFNNSLPYFIRDMIQFGNKSQIACSKYKLAIETETSFMSY